MEKVSIYKFYKFGCFVSDTKHLPNSITYNQLYNHITFIIDNINELDLSISKKMITAKLKEPLKILSSTKSKNKIESTKLLGRIKTVVNEIENVLEKELLYKYSYVPSNLKIDIDKLTNQQDKLFDIGVLERKNLPDSILENVFQFGQCYAFGTFTAASMHIVKATEEYNRFFNSVLNNSKIDLEKTWHDILKESKEILEPTNNKYNKELIDILYIIKNNYRNDIMHLNRMLDENETFDLFNMCSKVINYMNRILITLPNNGYI